MNPFPGHPGDRLYSQRNAARLWAATERETQGQSKRHEAAELSRLQQPSRHTVPHGPALTPANCGRSTLFPNSWGKGSRNPQDSPATVLFQMTPPSAPGSPRKTSSASRQQPQLCKREWWARLQALGRAPPHTWATASPPGWPSAQKQHQSAGRQDWLLLLPPPHTFPAACPPSPSLPAPSVCPSRPVLSTGPGPGLQLIQ